MLLLKWMENRFQMLFPYVNIYIMINRLVIK